MWCIVCYRTYVTLYKKIENIEGLQTDLDSYNVTGATCGKWNRILPNVKLVFQTNMYKFPSLVDVL